jgi:hypothetical protein
MRDVEQTLSMRVVFWLTCAAVTVLAAVSCGSRTARAPLQMGVSDRANEHVSLSAAGSTVVALWAATDAADNTDIYAAVSTDAAATFLAPVRVNALEGDARVNGEAPPQAALVTRADGGVDVVAVWTARRDGQNVLLTARSTDGGRSFGDTTIVPDTTAPGHRGWHTVGVSPSGAIDALWLDHRRAVTPAATEHRHQTESTRPARAATTYDSVAEAQKSDLYFARLGEGAPRALTPSVCFCCKTALAHAPAGIVYAAWRHVYAGDMRDIAFAVSKDDGRTFSAPVRVSEDRWSIAGCPDDGPSMAVDATGRVHLAWPTMLTEGAMTVKAVFYTTTVDGTTFTPRVRVSAGATPAHHPRVAAGRDGRVLVAWDEPAGEGSRVRIARATAAGQSTFVIDAPVDELTGRYPALAATGEAVLLAWVTGVGQNSRVHVQRR